jgi:hypothetical protein
VVACRRRDAPRARAVLRQLIARLNLDYDAGARGLAVVYLGALDELGRARFARARRILLLVGSAATTGRGPRRPA